VKPLLLALLAATACAALRPPKPAAAKACVETGRLVYDPRNAPVIETQTAGPSHVMGGDVEPPVRCLSPG
jgi:hypothetical protein